MSQHQPEARELAKTVCEYIRLFCSTCVVILLVLIAFTGIANRWCILQLPPIALFILLFIALTLLAYIEALHYGCVSVEKWDMTKYKDEYPRAYKCYLLVDTPEKVKKFLMGRQFYVIFVVFLIAEITVFPHFPDKFIGMPPLMIVVLLGTGLPGVAITLTFGQLISQIYVEEFCIQFLNMYGCEFCIHLALITEWTGVCHFSWLLYYMSSHFVCKTVCAAKKTDDAENAVEMSSPTTQNRGPDHVPLSQIVAGESLTVFDCFRYLWSTFATVGAVVIIMYGISLEAYVLPTPVAATYIIFFIVLTILFHLEGLMIAIVATQYWDRETFKDEYPIAYKLHELINRPDNVKRFIIGRQFCTVLTGFLLAQITTFPGWSGEGYNPVGFYIIVKSGLVGVLVVLAFGQLMPELLAQEYPLRFMNMPLSYLTGVISLFFDGLAVGHCAWTIYYATRRLCCVIKPRDAIDAKMNSGDVEELEVAK